MPFTCIRRNGPAWATAQWSVPSGGTTVRFSAARQKFSVALPPFHWASTVTWPLMVVELGSSPRPAAWV